MSLGLVVGIAQAPLTNNKKSISHEVDDSQQVAVAQQHVWLSRSFDPTTAVEGIYNGVKMGTCMLCPCDMTLKCSEKTSHIYI